MSFLSELSKPKAETLRHVDESEKADRSSANIALAGKDVLDDEAERWKYFFDSGCATWFDDIKNFTFTSTFCEISQTEASVICEHWEQRRRCLVDDDSRENNAFAVELLDQTCSKLESLRQRLDAAIAVEVERSPCSQAFVKLSTRSPKDSKKALAAAEEAYQLRLDEISHSSTSSVDDNTRWRLLCEETTRSGAVKSGAAGLKLLLDSERVYEDLEYALRGPPEREGEGNPIFSPGIARAWNMQLVARAWDPRLKPESEFRGIAWDGNLTCLCQYFHPLQFPELAKQRDVIEADVRKCFAEPEVAAAVKKLGGHCIIDFAWLGPGQVIIIELNPFDGVCLGTFPASTGLFLWDKPEDQAIMKGEAPFEFRIREVPLEESELKSQCNPTWRRIIYGT